jgi:hypothetical protein
MSCCLHRLSACTSSALHFPSWRRGHTSCRRWNCECWRAVNRYLPETSLRSISLVITLQPHIRITLCVPNLCWKSCMSNSYFSVCCCNLKDVLGTVYIYFTDQNMSGGQLNHLHILWIRFFLIVSFLNITIATLDIILSFIQNMMFCRLDSVSIFRWNILSWAK